MAREEREGVVDLCGQSPVEKAAEAARVKAEQARVKAAQEAEEQRQARAKELEQRQQANLDAIDRRFKQYEEKGLLDTQENANAISAWIMKNLDGAYNPAAIDLAIQKLGPTLKWKSSRPATPPTPAKPAQLQPVTPATVRLLDNGEEELDLNATESEMKRASILQLQDLSRRRKEGRQTWRSGWTGASL